MLATAGACLSIGSGIALGGSGGIGSIDPPQVKDVTCLQGCLDTRTVAIGGRVEVTGKRIGGTEMVRFKAAEGRMDVAPRAVEDESVRVDVPEGAESGKLVLVDAAGEKTRSPVELEVKPARAVDSAEGFEVDQAEATPRKSFFNGKRKTEVEYLFKADGPTDVRIDVVKAKSGRVVDSIVERDQEPFESHSARWNGLKNGRVAANGKYRFRVRQLSGGAGKSSRFKYYDHIFPLRGRHTYGDGLGAGRGHQGQDVFAKCGTRIVAARGGKVQVKAYQSAAGYYVVIDGRKTGRDYVYMHMEKRGRAKQGSRVHTGDVIGYESDTGDATGCHMHFELWSSPGWYEGGHVLDPTQPLKRWDDWS